MPRASCRRGKVAVLPPLVSCSLPSESVASDLVCHRGGRRRCAETEEPAKMTTPRMELLILSRADERSLGRPRLMEIGLANSFSFSW